MSLLSNFSMPVPPSIAAVGGVVVGDTTSPCGQFIERFGASWKRVPKSKTLYVLFDKKHDRVCFTLQNGEIAVYNGVSRAEFISSWEGDKVLLGVNAIYRAVDHTYKHHYLQVLELMKEFGID